MGKENKKKIPFIMTSNSETKDLLLSLNYTFLHEENGKYIFLNDSTMKFDMNGNEIKLDNICYTNKLFM